MLKQDILFTEIERHLLEDDAPSGYLNQLFRTPAFRQYPYDMLHRLKCTDQSPIHHPEGNVWNHTMLVVNEAARRKRISHDPRVFMWAALLHDIGKPSTTKVRKGKITSYNHDKEGAVLSEEFLRQCTTDTSFIQDVSALVRYHMHILYVINKLPFADINKMKQDTDIHETALLGLCDRLGRLNTNEKEEEEKIQKFLCMCG